MGPDNLYEALIEAVKACGGTKVVAPRLWGEGTVEDTILKAKKLATCLNPERNEKLSLHEVMQILRMAREVGHVGVLTYLCDDLRCTRPVQINPEDEKARIQREFIETGKRMEQMFQRIQELESAPRVRSVA